MCRAFTKGINEDESDFRFVGTKKLSVLQGGLHYKFFDNDKKQSLLNEYEVERIVCSVTSLGFKSPPDEKIRIASDLVLHLQFISKNQEYTTNFYRDMDHPEVRHQMTIYEKH